MKQLLLTALLTLVSFVGFSQYKNVNQKLYFVNGIKIGDTLKVDSAGIYGSGHFLKIQDTTTSPWTVIRSEIDATDTSFFNRASNKITPKNAGDTIEAAGLDLNGLSGSGSFLKIGDDNRVTRGVETDTSFFNRISNKIIPKNIGDTIEAAGLDLNGLSGSGSFLKIGDDNRVTRGVATDTSFFTRTANGTIQPKTETDSLYLGSNLNATELNLKGQFTQSKGEAFLDNTMGGPKLLVLSGAHNVDTIAYGGPFRAEVGALVNTRVGTFLTIVGTSGVVDDSAAVFLDSPPFYLNGNDTLGSGDILQLYIYNETKFLEVSRSDN